jgi:hypothetical protein
MRKLGLVTSPADAEAPIAAIRSRGEPLSQAWIAREGVIHRVVCGPAGSQMAWVLHRATGKEGMSWQMDFPAGC